MPNPFPSIIKDPDLILESPVESEEEEIEVVIRENINTDDIFEQAQAPVEPEEPEPAPPAKAPSVQPVVKEKKKRKPMTEEHKEKLKLAREKAMLAKKKNALERKELKELETKATVKKKATKKKELQDIVNDVPPPRPTAEIDPQIIETAIAEALQKNEIMRQRRKEKKKADKDEAIEKAKAEEEIRKAIYPPGAYYGDNGFFSKNIYGLR
tara:strand:+ start:2058 stop:2690 length:633 start_codon:yes stop_codon:yes gene_type:complete